MSDCALCRSRRISSFANRIGIIARDALSTWAIAQAILPTQTIAGVVVLVPGREERARDRLACASCPCRKPNPLVRGCESVDARRRCRLLDCVRPQASLARTRVAVSKAFGCRPPKKIRMQYRIPITTGGPRLSFQGITVITPRFRVQSVG